VSFSLLSGFGVATLATPHSPLLIVRGEGSIGPLVFSLVDSYVIQFVAQTGGKSFSASHSISITAYFYRLVVTGIPPSVTAASGAALPKFTVQTLDSFDKISVFPSGFVKYHTGLVFFRHTLQLLCLRALPFSQTFFYTATAQLSCFLSALKAFQQS
jgi:hypothetical protein